MLEKKLSYLGYTNNQISVYLALLELGQTKIGPLLKKTGIHRTIVYRALEDLIKSKLASKISKRGIMTFYALEPKPLLDEQNMRKDTAVQAIKEIENIRQKTFSESLILSGKQGIKDLCEMVIKEKSDYFVIGGTFNIVSELGEDYEYYKNRFSKSKIEPYILLQNEYKNVLDENKKDFKNIKLLPKNYITTPVVLWIFGDTVAHVIWEEVETIFVMRNKKIADKYKDLFKNLWEK